MLPNGSASAEDCVDEIRRQRDKLTARGGISPKATYAGVRRAFSMRRASYLCDVLDRGALPAAGKWERKEGFDPPPPRSGGWVYHALFEVYKCAVEHPLVIAALDIKQRAGAEYLVAFLLFSHLKWSHVHARQAWYESAPYVCTWVVQIENALFNKRGRGLKRFLLAGPHGKAASPLPGSKRPEKLGLGGLVAWARAVGVTDTACSRALADAAWKAGAAASSYAAALRQVCGSRSATRVLLALHQLEVAGNEFCASSAQLVTPGFEALCDVLNQASVEQRYGRR